MEKKRVLWGAPVLALVFGFVLMGCGSSPKSRSDSKAAIINDAIINNDAVVGTWGFGNNNVAILIQYRPDGSGAEIMIDTRDGIDLSYTPFTYSLTATMIKTVLSLQEGTKDNPVQYKMPSVDSLMLINYVEGFSPTLERQPAGKLEGIWERKTGEGTVSQYLFFGGMALAINNSGNPFEFGDATVTDTTLTINIAALGVLGTWVKANSQKVYEYQLEGDRLSWADEDGEVVFVKK